MGFNLSLPQLSEDALCRVPLQSVHTDDRLRQLPGSGRVSSFEKQVFLSGRCRRSPDELTTRLGMARLDEMNPTVCQKTITRLVIPLELMERMMHMLSKGKINHRSHLGLIFRNTSISILVFEKGRRIKKVLTE